MLTFSIAIAVFSLVTIFSGKLQDKYGPRIIATAGGIFLGVGIMLSSTATSLIELYIYYGIIGGIGVGTAYVCPLATSLKWFPHNKGLITGISVGAFGMATLIFKPVIQLLISNKGVSEAFFYIGLVFMIIVVIGAQFLRLPNNDIEKKETKGQKDIKGEKDYTAKEMIQKREFYYIWGAFFLGTMPGLMIISLATNIGTDIVGLSSKKAANIVIIASVFNASGRVFWGLISDRIGRFKPVIIMFGLTFFSMITMGLGFINEPIFYICVSTVVFCFGGFLSIFPSITADLFGIKNIGLNYGIIFQANGLAGIIGPLLGSNLDYYSAFMITSIIAIIGILVFSGMYKSFKEL